MIKNPPPEDSRFDALKLKMTRLRVSSQGWTDRWALQTLKEDDVVKDALQTLTISNISSCPVMDDSNRYKGFIDMLQLVEFLTTKGRRPRPSKSKTEEKKCTRHEFLNTKLSDFLAKRTQPPFVREDASVYQALEKLADDRVHRICVVDRNNVVKGVVTQTDMCEFLESHLNLIGDAAQTLVNDIRPFAQLITVPSTTKALQGFELLSAKGASGVAVVDPSSGMLVDCLSVKDLRGIGIAGEDFHEVFAKDIKGFKKIVRDRYQALDRRWGGWVTNKGTLEDVLKKMTQKRIHRVFVVDADQKPEDVISQTDVLSFFLKKEQGFRSTWLSM